MYKALISFSGVESMRKGEVKAITNIEVVADLLRAGYIEEVKAEPKAKPKAEPKPAPDVKPTPKKKPQKKTAKK